jgi:NADH-quinone oxidoreductase subunit N
MTLFLRFTYGVLADASDSWQQIVMIIAVLSMLIGAGGAIMQTDIKRLMAYSSIAHMGYALVGVAAASDLGIGAVMLYMTIYVISSIGVFAIILSLKQEGRPLTRIEDLAGFSKTHPVYALAMMVLMFSMAGIPPMGGFFGKWYVFSAAIASGHVTLAIIGVLASVIGAFYYIRIIKVMYVDDQVISIDSHIPRSNTMIALGAAVVMAVFLFGLGALREQITAAVPFVVFVAG